MQRLDYIQVSIILELCNISRIDGEKDEVMYQCEVNPSNTTIISALGAYTSLYSTKGTADSLWVCVS